MPVVQHFPWPALAHAPLAGESWSLVIRGAQHGQLGFRTAVDEQGHGSRDCSLGHNQPAPWNKVILGLGMMCPPGHASLQKGWNQLVNMNMEAVNADYLMLSWSLVSYMTSRKVLSADWWAAMCFQRGYGCTTCLEDVRNLCSQSCMRLMKGWEKHPTEPKRSLAATVCSCKCQQASTTWKSVLRRFSCSWGRASPSFLLCSELLAPCKKWTWKNYQKT